MRIEEELGVVMNFEYGSALLLPLRTCTDVLHGGRSLPTSAAVPAVLDLGRTEEAAALQVNN